MGRLATIQIESLSFVDDAFFNETLDMMNNIPGCTFEVKTLESVVTMKNPDDGSDGFIDQDGFRRTLILVNVLTTEESIFKTAKLIYPYLTETLKMSIFMSVVFPFVITVKKDRGMVINRTLIDTGAMSKANFDKFMEYKKIFDNA